MSEAAATVKVLEEQVAALEVEVSDKDKTIEALATDAAPGPVEVKLNDSFAEFKVYDDDVALGQKCPSLESIEWFNGEAPTVGAGKVTVVTFFSKLNKSDFSTLTAMTDFADKYGDKMQVVAISRDGSDTDVSKFCGKFQDKFFAELSGPGGSAGVTVKAHYPLGFDKDGAVNTQFKELCRKAVVGVGFTFIVNGEGNIVWHEVFVRGASYGQFEAQLAAVVAGTPMESNGNAPVVEEREEAVGDFEDPFAATGDGY